jgi:hypothetical protein
VAPAFDGGALIRALEHNGLPVYARFHLRLYDSNAFAPVTYFLSTQAT